MALKKRALEQNFTIIYAGIVVIIIIFTGVFFINSVNKSLEDKKINNFILTIGNSIKKSSALSTGSAESISISLPFDSDEVCFVDRNTEYDEFAKNELNTISNNFENSNLFIKYKNTFKEFRAFKAEQFSLEKNPLCIKPLNGKLILEIKSSKGKAVMSGNENVVKQECTRILYNGNPDNKIDIVFLPLKYSNQETFKNDITKAIEEFRDIEPFKSSVQKINFFAVEDFNALNCKISSFIQCDNNQITLLASKCPNDFAVVLVDRNTALNFISPVRSSTIGEIMKINSAENYNVIVHEFGHAFGNLADEYVYNSFPEFSIDTAPNCDYEGCTKWNSIEGTTCDKGCTLGEFYRPTQDSLMRSLDTKLFGPVNTKALENKLGRYEND